MIIDAQSFSFAPKFLFPSNWGFSALNGQKILDTKVFLQISNS